MTDELTRLKELEEIAQRLIALCPSSEGLGGHGPIQAFLMLGERARAVLGCTVVKEVQETPKRAAVIQEGLKAARLFLAATESDELYHAAVKAVDKALEAQP